MKSVKDVKRVLGARAPRSQGVLSHAAEFSTVNGVNDVNAMNDDWKVVRRGRKAPSRGVRRT